MLTFVFDLFIFNRSLERERHNSYPLRAAANLCLSPPPPARLRVRWRFEVKERGAAHHTRRSARACVHFLFLVRARPPRPTVLEHWAGLSMLQVAPTATMSLSPIISAVGTISPRVRRRTRLVARRHTLEKIARALSRFDSHNYTPHQNDDSESIVVVVQI